MMSLPDMSATPSDRYEQDQEVKGVAPASQPPLCGPSGGAAISVASPAKPAAANAIDRYRETIAAHKRQDDAGVIFGMAEADSLLAEIEYLEAAVAPHEVFYVQFAEGSFGEHIRKWSRSPFDGARLARVAMPDPRSESGQ